MDTPLLADVARGDVVLAGRYQLRSLLGSGGMAQVYDGWDTRLARPVAIKLLRSDLAASEDLRRRFELEARAAARLTHPNVVAVYDAGDDNGRSFIVMERLSGESLADRVRQGPVDGPWLRRLAGEVLAALGAAHDAGIVHRDIKPGNILFGPDGRAKVADFGIARVVEPLSDDTAAALTGAGLVVGTPAYLAPERAMGHSATVQSDIYALGVVLYEALTGRKPYQGSTPAAIAAAAVQGVAANPLTLRPGADQELVAVIGRAMALDPAQRYGSASEMAADLHRSDPAPTAVMAALPTPALAATVPDAAVVPGAGGPGLPAGVVPAGAVPAGAVPAGPAAVPAGLAAAGFAGARGPAVRPSGPSAGPARAGSARSRDRDRNRPLPGGRRTLLALGVGALAVAAVALILARPGTGSSSNTRASTASSAPATTDTSQPTTASSTPLASPGATSATTTPSGPAAALNPSDPIAVALGAVARQLSRSKSQAAAQLAAGLNSVAVAPDGSARTSLASSLQDQVVGWYQQGQITTGEYATATAILHIAGAPAAPSPAAKRTGAGGGGGGGD